MSDDRDLWDRALAGDGEAFGALFDRHYGRVRGYAARLLTGSSDADDAAASAFLELWRRRRSVRIVDESVLPWLLVTTANVTRNMERSRRRYRRFLGALPRPTAQPDAADSAFVDDLSGVDARLRRAVAALASKDAELLNLVAVRDLSVADAADALGLTESAAKARLYRARVRVRDVLGEPSESEVER